MTVNTPLPYYETFNYPDGSPWPYGDAQTSGWLIPGPSGMSGSTTAIQGGGAGIHLTPDWAQGVPMFNARLPIDNAPTFDLTFTIDTAEIVPLMSVRGASCYFYVQLENPVTGSIQYELSYDYDWDEDGGINHAAPRLRARMNRCLATGFFDLGEGHTLSAALSAGTVSVRIQESGTQRLFKVWQDFEPHDWTIVGTAPAHSGPRFIDLSVYSIQDSAASIYLEEIGANATDVANWHWEAVGQTQHFNFWYDSSLGPQGAIDAAQEMANIEEDLLNHFRWFGNTAPWSNGPARVDVKYYNDSNSPRPMSTGPLAWYEPSVHTISLNWTEPTQNQDLDTLPKERAIVVHELVHHFQDMTFLGGYMRYQSFQEAHAAFLERQFRAVIDPASLREGAYASFVGDFLNSKRPNYVTQSYTSDQVTGGEVNLAIGCQLLFLNWLRYQKGYSAVAITQSQSFVKWGTPQSIYAALTGDLFIDPSVKWFAELEQAFPVGTHVDTSSWPDIANPYPLHAPTASGSGGAALGGAIFGTVKGGSVKGMVSGVSG